MHFSFSVAEQNNCAGPFGVCAAASINGNRNRFAFIFSSTEKINSCFAATVRCDRLATGKSDLDGFDSRLQSKIIAQAPLGSAQLFGAGNRNRTGTLFTARDFKSLVSTYSTMPASFRYRSTNFACRQEERGQKKERAAFCHPFISNHSWSIFRLKGSRHSSMNHCSSGMSMASMASMDCLAAKSNSVLPAFCSSTHLI